MPWPVGVGRPGSSINNRQMRSIMQQAARPNPERGHSGATRARARGAPPAAALLCGVSVLAWLLVGAAGCGFKLRGLAKLPEQFQQTRLVGVEPFSDIGVALRDAFRINGATLGAAEQGATAVLNIEETSRKRKVLGVSSSGKAQSFQLTYRVRFSAETIDGKLLFPSQTIELRQDYEYDPEQLLSRENAEETATREMMRQASWRIIERLGQAPAST